MLVTYLKKINQLEPKLEADKPCRAKLQIHHSANAFKLQGRDSCYYKYPGDGNQAQSQDGDGNQSQDEIKSWEPQEQEIDEDDPCYYKYPGDGNQAQSQDGDGNQSQDEIKSWYDRSKRRPTSPDAITIWRWQCIESDSGEKCIHSFKLPEDQNDKKRSLTSFMLLQTQWIIIQNQTTLVL